MTGAVVAGMAAPADAAVAVPAAASRSGVLVDRGSMWRINDRGTDLGAAWRTARSTGRGWTRGAAEIGFGDRTVVTKVARKRTVYLRKAFTVTDAGSVRALRLRTRVDDGAAFYLNGVPVARQRLAADATYRTRATKGVAGARERRWSSFRLPVSALRTGRNLLAVEVHNRDTKDLRFDAKLVQRSAGAVAPSRSSASAPLAVSDTQPDTTRVMCRIDNPNLRELSGLASSVNFPGILWTHNDSGDSARIFALDANTCQIRAVVTLAGVTAKDFEAISIGRNPAGQPVIWVGDTGDNYSTRANVKLYRFVEPTQLVDQTVTPKTVTVTWSDGRRNCEGLIVEPVPEGRVYLVSKEASSGVYQLRGDYRTTGVATTGTRLYSTRSYATDAATSPDRSKTIIRFGDYGTVFQGLPGTAPRNITFPDQLQGEAITFSRDSSHVFIASEGVQDLIRIPVADL